MTTLASAGSVQQGPIIAGFVGIFGDDWDQRVNEKTPFDKVNRVCVAFAKIIEINQTDKKDQIDKTDRHYTIVIDGPEERVPKLIELVKKVNPTAEIFLSIGCGETDGEFDKAANDPDFAGNCLTFLKSFGSNSFDGLDIDWENFLDKEGLNKLTTNLSEKLHPNNYKLTLDGWPFSDPSYDMEVLQKNLDQINIMSYGVNITLESCCEQYVKQGFPINKIIGGIETEIDYPEGVDTLGPNGTIAAKAKYALRVGAKGMMSWRIDNDFDKSSNNPTYKGADQLYFSMTAQKN